jgi:hypothetical protein
MRYIWNEADSIDAQLGKKQTAAPNYELIEALTGMPIDILKYLYSMFIGQFVGVPRKSELVRQISQALSFSTEDEYNAWFAKLSVLTQRLTVATFYDDYVALKPIENELNITIAEKETQRWQDNWHFVKEHELSFFTLYGCNDQPCVSIPKFLRIIVAPWLPPLRFSLDDCVAAEPAAPWDDSSVVPDSITLLHDAICELIAPISPMELRNNVQNAYSKDECANLRKDSGFLSFPDEENAPESVDLAARFILIMSNFRPKRPDDGLECIRSMVNDFFCQYARFTVQQIAPDRSFLEYSLLLEHFTRTYSHIRSREIPGARAIFQDILLKIAADGRCFDADKLAEFIKKDGKPFYLSYAIQDGDLRLGAETLSVNGLTYTTFNGNNFFSPQYMLRFPLLLRPLFKAYCYLFAALGLLEITQRVPSFDRVSQGNAMPISLYDSLATIRITQLGRWCLNLTEERPVRDVQPYEAIADKELFLVTLQGPSLERKLYLEHIGVKLGKDRWRISFTSFIAGCANRHQVVDRIKRFYELIAAKPASHWTKFFDKLVTRAGFFNTPRDDMLVYDLPADKECVEELLRDPLFKQIAFRTEGRMLLVPKSKERAFAALLADHGIARF